MQSQMLLRYCGSFFTAQQTKETKGQERARWHHLQHTGQPSIVWGLTTGAPCEVSQVTHASSEAGCTSLASRMHMHHMISTGSSEVLVILPGHTAYTACSKTHLIHFEVQLGEMPPIQLLCGSGLQLSIWLLNI